MRTKTHPESDRAELNAAVDQLGIAIAALCWAVERGTRLDLTAKEAGQTDLGVEERMAKRTPATPNSEKPSDNSAVEQKEAKTVSSDAATDVVMNQDEQHLAIEAAFAERMLRTRARESSQRTDDHMRMPAPTIATHVVPSLDPSEDQVNVTTAPTEDSIVESRVTDEEDQRFAIEDAFAERFLPAHSAGAKAK